MNPTPAQVHAHEAAFRATLSPPQLAEYDRIEREREALAEPEDEPEVAAPRAREAAFEGFYQQNALNFSDSFIERRLGADAAKLANLVQHLNGGKACYFGWQYMAERFGWSRRQYTNAREALREAKILHEERGTGGDARMRLTVDPLQVKAISRTTAREAFEAICANPSLQWMVRNYGVIEIDSPVDNSSKDEGLPLVDFDTMVPKEGFTISRFRDNHCYKSEQSKEEESISKSLSPANARANSEPPREDKEGHNEHVKTGPTSPAEVVRSVLNLAEATPAERTFVLDKLNQSHNVEKPASWAKVVLAKYRANPPKDSAHANAPPPLGPDGRTRIRNDFLANNPPGAPRPSEPPPEFGNLLEDLRQRKRI